MLVSGDRESEVRYLAEQVGITEIYAEQSPSKNSPRPRGNGEGQNPLRRRRHQRRPGDDGRHRRHGDRPEQRRDRGSRRRRGHGQLLSKVDEFMHISRRMRIIALQSAVGGMALSVIGMVFAATGHLSPVSGAIAQEVIDVLAVLNALRAAFPPKVIHDL
jgi:hypothetical protein